MTVDQWDLLGTGINLFLLLLILLILITKKP